VRSAGWEDRGRDASGQWLVRQERPGAVPMTDHIWQGVPAIVLGRRHIGGSVQHLRGALSRSERTADNSGARGTGARRCEEGIA